MRERAACRDGASQELRLLVPASLCGSIIGKGGATIRQFAEDSKAAIGLSPQVPQPTHPPLPPTPQDTHTAAAAAA